MNNKSKSLDEKFWDRIEKTNGCWNWTGGCTKAGYGQLQVEGKVWRAHRLSYYIHHGSIPEGLGVMQLCDNRRCVNPEHMELGTQKDVVAKMIERGRKYRGKEEFCGRGHRRTPKTLRIDARGRRVCRICAAASVAASRARKRESND